MKRPALPARLGRPRLNPVLARELAQRMRGRQAWVVLMLYLALLALILRLVYGEIGRDPFSGDLDVLASATAGRAIFHWLLFFMLALVCFIVPGVTAGAISGERERQTLVSLQVTLLSPLAIVSGKLWASLAYVLLLVVAALPLVGVTFVLGGVALGEVLAGLAMVVLAALALASLALAASAVFRRTQGATVAAYAVTATLALGTLVLYGFQVVVDRGPDGGFRQPSPAVLALNPFVATADVVRGRSTDRSLTSPFRPLQDAIGTERAPAVAIDRAIADGPVPPDVVIDGRLVPAEGPAGDFGAFGFVDVAEPAPRRVAGLRLWVASTVLLGLLSAGAAGLAVRRVTVPSSSAEA